MMLLMLLLLLRVILLTASIFKQKGGDINRELYLLLQ